MELKTYFAQDAAGNIISSAIVNVFLQGTTTLATGLTRADGTPLENPFAADGAGRIQFRAPDGYYDVQVSAGPGIIQTLTIQCVDYSEAKADADRAESAADRSDVSAEQAQNALNSITGINTNFEQNSREQWRRALAEIGLNLVSGSFEEGATANSSTDAVWHIGGGQCYTWGGAFPKAVPAESTPTSTGGAGPSAWVSVGGASLRSNLSENNGALIVGGAILECQTVAQAQAISGLTEGRKVRTYYYNTPVVTDWVFTSSTPSDGVFYIPAVGGYLILMTPNFASAGIIEGEYVPLNAAHNRNVIQKLVRDTRFSKFEYGATGTFYVLGSIHPLRDNIEIHHEAGVTVMGRYDDPTVGPEIMGLNSGGMWSFAHFLNPDATVWSDNNYTITAVMKNVTYILNGKIGTEYNSIHSQPHNNNPIGFFNCENCSVVGSGGVISSDHRGINVDGGGDNCRIDIGYATGTSNNPLQMKINSERYAFVRVGAVYGVKFDGGQTKAVVWCGGGRVDVEVGNYRWDGVNKPILAYGNGCQEITLKAGIISGVSQLIRQYNTPVARVLSAWVNNTDSLINKAEDPDKAGVTKISEIRGVNAVDAVLTSAFYDETKRANQDVVTITGNDFRNASSSFLYFKGKTGAGAIRMWNVNNNLDPVGITDLSDWNILTGQSVVTTVSATSFTYTMSRRYENITIAVTESATLRYVTVSLRAHLSSVTTATYIVGGTTMTAARSGDIFTFTVNAGTINFYVLHN